MIRPLLAARVRAAMTKIQTAPKPPTIIDVIGEKPVIQKTTAPVPKYRVMWDWEMDNFKGISERRANEPCVFRLGELTDNKNGHYSKLTREWQFFWFDLCSRICFGGRTHEKLTKQEYKWLADKWTSMTATTTAFTNQKGTDRCSNFITNERLGKNDELPMIYTLICGGASLAGDPVFDAGNGRWMLKVARFDGNRPPPPVETIDPYTDPRVFFATTIDPSLVKNNYEITPFDSKSGARASAKPVAEGYRVNPFPQFDKARFLNREGLFDCPVPIVATRDVRGGRVPGCSCW